ncbi:MAG: SpoIIE family protein phosphatase [Chlorobi bacterium]|nr:SpoIIE family protein phosphatase [Chlorobiota bacterium]
MAIKANKQDKQFENLAKKDAMKDSNELKSNGLSTNEEYKKALNKVRHRSIELFSERQILRKALKQINFQKLEIEKQKNEIQQKNKKLNKALAKARKRTIDLFGKHVDLKKAKKYISIINEDVEKKNIRLEKAVKKARKRTIDLFGKHIDLKKAKKRIENQGELLQQSFNELEIKNTQINDSIDYAKHIQQAILPPEEQIKACFPDSFVFFKPKEVVSGDFYWFTEKKDTVYLAVIDCTGHGVPGALMSMIGNTLLNKIVNDNNNISSAKLLEKLDSEIFNAFYREKKDSDFQNDGMDLTICRYDKRNNEISISSAGHNYIVINNGKLEMYKGNLLGIGEIIDIDFDINYEEQKFLLTNPLQIYMFSDGFADQFGGDKDKKFHNSQLKKLIYKNHMLPMNEQKQIFNKVFNEWKGAGSQTDDVLLIGINLIS